MRPVNRGQAPNPYAQYEDAADDLKGSIGNYCSYCERQIETHLAVEHKQPQLHNGPLVTTWTNFLLSCVNCNSSKGHGVIMLANYYWPDTDNTLRALEFTTGGLVQPNTALTGPQQAIAEATIQLTGLDKNPANQDINRRPTHADKRWRRRLEAWDLATHYRNKLAANDTVETREAIPDIAASRGMFSIWWTVFAGDADIRRRLRLAFQGTEGRCFDAAEQPVQHPTGQI